MVKLVGIALLIALPISVYLRVGFIRIKPLFIARMQIRFDAVGYIAFIQIAKVYYGK